MKNNWKLFLILNVVELICFTMSFIVVLYWAIYPNSGLIIPFWALTLIILMFVIVYYNCLRNIFLTRAVLGERKDINVNQGMTRLLIILFSIVIFLLALGLIQGYENLRFGLNPYVLTHLLSYIFQTLAVISGVYILYHQSNLSKLIAYTADTSIKKSIDDIGL